MTLMLDRNGWAVNYLGADTPMSELTRTAREISPDLVVLAAVTGERYHGPTAALTRLAAVAPVALAGPGATEALALATGCRLLAGDPVTEAQAVAGSPKSTRRRRSLKHHCPARPERGSPVLQAAKPQRTACCIAEVRYRRAAAAGGVSCPGWRAWRSRVSRGFTRPGGRAWGGAGVISAPGVDLVPRSEGAGLNR
jgi:hypothetical protein